MFFLEASVISDVITLKWGTCLCWFWGRRMCFSPLDRGGDRTTKSRKWKGPHFSDSGNPWSLKRSYVLTAEIATSSESTFYVLPSFQEPALKCLLHCHVCWLFLFLLLFFFFFLTTCRCLGAVPWCVPSGNREWEQWQEITSRKQMCVLILITFEWLCVTKGDILIDF